MNERHGSQTFYKLLEEMEKLHDAKSHDYASNEDPMGNYHFAGKMACMFAHSPEDAGFFGRFSEKIYRLINLENSGKTPKNESIEDTERDLCVIVALWMADRRDRRNKKSNKQTNKLPYICEYCSCSFDYEATRFSMFLFCSESCKDKYMHRIGIYTGKGGPLST